MSTLAFAALTNRREEATPGTSTSAAPPGLRSYVDALAALIPAEVLTLHAVILSFTTETTRGPDGKSVTTITDPQTLGWAFVGLAVLAIILYLVPRRGRWDILDIVRAAVPPAAFVAWTMIQRATAFDAVSLGLQSGRRTLIALFVAVVWVWLCQY